MKIKDVVLMGKIAETVEIIYKSELPLNDKIIRLIEYGRKCGINSYNFEILLGEIRKYEWEKRDYLRG